MSSGLLLKTLKIISNINDDNDLRLTTPVLLSLRQLASVLKTAVLVDFAKFRLESVYKKLNPLVIWYYICV